MNRSVLNFLVTLGVTIAALVIYRVVTIKDTDYNIYDFLTGKNTATLTSVIAQGRPVLRGEPVMDLNDFEVLTQVNSALADLAEAVVPSVVSIDTKTTVNVKRTYSSDPYGIFLYQRNHQMEKPGLGSGAIVSEDGYIVTNHHVVTGVDEIQVTTHDGSKFAAEWIGSDPNADIAVLKIVQPEGVDEEMTFKPLPFGNSDSVRVGEMALAIGNPFGLSETVTRGIISAKQRQLSDSANVYFQVDAVINPGNSGGPLVNIRGEIIGVNVAIFTGQQDVKVWQGIGLAVPSNEAKEIYEAIAHNRPLARGYIGVDLDDIPQRYLRIMQIPVKNPAMVIDVAKDSPAESVGLEPGDVIIEFDGRQVSGARDVLNRIQRKKAGERARITILRRDSKLVVEPEFISKSGQNSLELKKTISENGMEIAKALGLTVKNLGAEERDQFNIREDYPAILITSVEPGSQAANRFRSGDLIHLINRDHVSSVQKFYDLLGSLPEDKSSMMILSRNGERIAAVLNP